MPTIAFAALLIAGPAAAQTSEATDLSPGTIGVLDVPGPLPYQQNLLLPADQQPKPRQPPWTMLSGNGKTNFDSSMQVLAQHGDGDLAARIVKHADEGYIVVNRTNNDPSTEVVGTYKGQIALPPRQIDPRGRLDQPLNQSDDRQRIKTIDLAMTLVHEMRHADQPFLPRYNKRGEKFQPSLSVGNLSEAYGYGNQAEVQAWSAGYEAAQRWLNHAQGEFLEARARNVPLSEQADLAREVRLLAKAYADKLALYPEEYGAIDWKDILGKDFTNREVRDLLQQLIDNVEQFEEALLSDEAEAAEAREAAEREAREARDAAELEALGAAILGGEPCEDVASGFNEDGPPDDRTGEAAAQLVACLGNPPPLPPPWDPVRIPPPELELEHDRERYQRPRIVIIN